AKDFIGRSNDLDTLLRHAKSESRTNGLLISSAPGSGVSELLRQTYDQLFHEQGEIVPFYFAPRKSDRTARQSATRFLQSFLQQIVAFRRQDSKILDLACDVCELAELALPSDGYWIDRLIEACQNESRLNDELAFVRSCLSAPLRALANGTGIFVIVDDLHETEYFTGEIDFVEELSEIFAGSNAQFVFGGRRRFLFDKKSEAFENLQIKPLSFIDSGLLVENLSDRYGVRINEQTRDLMTVQFGANPLCIKFLILWA